MRRYRDKRHGCARFVRDTYNGVVSFFIRSVNKCFSAATEWNIAKQALPDIRTKRCTSVPGVMKNYVGSYLRCQTNLHACNQYNPSDGQYGSRIEENIVYSQKCIYNLLYFNITIL